MTPSWLVRGTSGRSSPRQSDFALGTRYGTADSSDLTGARAGQIGQGHAMQSLLTVEQLSIYLHKSVTSIRSDAHRNPSSLPPICRLPHTKRLLWRVEDVERWLASHVTGQTSTETSAPIPEPTRGRPTKAEQIARQRQAAQSATTARPSRSYRLRGKA